MRSILMHSSYALLSFALLSTRASAITISYNGTCVYQDCSNPAATLGMTDSHNFSYNTTFANGDEYNVAGNVQDLDRMPVAVGHY